MRASLGRRRRRRAEIQVRDREGREAAAITGVVDLDGKQVVEVGCGTGRLTAVVARATRVYTFDPVAEAKESLARDLRDRARFAVHDA